MFRLNSVLLVFFLLVFCGFKLQDSHQLSLQKHNWKWSVSILDIKKGDQICLMKSKPESGEIRFLKTGVCELNIPLRVCVRQGKKYIMQKQFQWKQFGKWAMNGNQLLIANDSLNVVLDEYYASPGIDTLKFMVNSVTRR